MSPPCSLNSDQSFPLSLIICLALISVLSACATLPSQQSTIATERPSIGNTQIFEDLTSSPPTESSSSEQISNQRSLIRQWGSEAAATTEYADPEWSAENATGAPDTTQCGDFQSAYASAASDGIDTLAITYTVPVYATSLNIIQSYNPNQVTEVELIGINGDRILVYSTPPVQVDQPCPYTLSVSFERTPFKVEAVHLKLDQSVLGLGWNEIDAVELVGETQ